MNRLKALDGLRTLAILMVILTHIPQDWLSSLPNVYRPLIYFFTASGKIGVGIIFLMTGFLMARLHPRPAGTVNFWARRLARIFPLFLVMVLSLSLIRANGNSWPILTQLDLVLSFALIARILKRQIGPKLTIAWLGLMAAAAIFYCFFLLKIPPAVYYQIWSLPLRSLITGLVNATMALPFGQYVAQLDGVYWAVILEAWFYLLYPVLFVPLLAGIGKIQSWRRQAGLFIASAFFCFGLSLLAERILGLTMVNPVFIIYFIAGAGLGSNLTWWQKQALRLPRTLLRPIGLIFILILISAGQFWLTRVLPGFYLPWMWVILALPVSLLVLISTLGNKYWGRWLGRPALTFFAKYGYSIFLTHSLVIEWLFKLIKPNNLFTGLWFIILCLSATACLSVILYNLAEKPYFITQKLANKTTAPGYFKPLLALTLIMIFLLDRAFRPPLAMFTIIDRDGGRGNNISLGQEPLRLPFTGRENNLGMITTHLRGQLIPEVKGVTKEPSQLMIRLYDEQNQIIAATAYKAADIYEDSYHPFGFPIQAQSRGKQYILEYQLIPTDLSRQVKLIDSEQKFISVYFRPANLGHWLINKLTSPLTSPLFWFTLLNLAPLLIMLKLICYK